MQNIKTLGQPLLGEKYGTQKEEKKEEFPLRRWGLAPPLTILTHVSPKLCFNQNLIFCDLKPHAKFQNLRTTPSGRKVCDREKEERKKNNPFAQTKYSAGANGGSCSRVCA